MEFGVTEVNGSSRENFKSLFQDPRKSAFDAYTFRKFGTEHKWKIQTASKNGLFS